MKYLNIYLRTVLMFLLLEVFPISGVMCMGQKKNDEAKFNEYLVKAQAGDAKSQYKIGYSYEKGKGVSQDYSKAIEWYSKAVNQGFLMATYRLAICQQKTKSKREYIMQPELKSDLKPEIIQQQPVQQDNNIDINIPTVKSNNNKTFAVITDNENYQRVTKVDFANNDAKIFATYCQKTLGLPEYNIRSYYDATFASMMMALKDIAQIAKAYKGDINIIFFYAGHGVPNESTREAFLLPVDVDGSQTDLCFSVGKLYKELNAMNANKVVVLMDACFSGSKRGNGMLASARGVALKVKDDSPMGNMVVLSAATEDQTAFPYNEKGHGMFTYFLLKKLQETKGETSLGELAEYVTEQVSQQSVVINRKMQTPTTLASPDIAKNWKSLKLN